MDMGIWFISMHVTLSTSVHWRLRQRSSWSRHDLQGISWCLNIFWHHFRRQERTSHWGQTHLCWEADSSCRPTASWQTDNALSHNLHDGRALSGVPQSSWTWRCRGDAACRAGHKTTRELENLTVLSWSMMEEFQLLHFLTSLKSLRLRKLLD